MDFFVRRLIQRLYDPTRPLSRNRHYHTFNNPEGRYALKIARRLRALQKDIVACEKEGRRAVFVRQRDDEGTYQIELRMDRVRGRWTSLLEADEFELLLEMPGMKEIIGET